MRLYKKKKTPRIPTEKKKKNVTSNIQKNE